MLLVYGDGVPVQPWPKFGANNPSKMEIGASATAVPLPPGSNSAFAGEIACFAVHEHTLPPYQTTLLIDTCWHVLGGPKAVETPAHPICDPIPQCSGLPNVTGASIVTIYPHPLWFHIRGNSSGGHECHLQHVSLEHAIHPL